MLALGEKKNQFFIVFQRGLYRMFKIIVILILIFYLTDAANILAIFTIPSINTQRLYRIVTNALEDRGHNLTIISSIPGLGRGISNEIDLGFSNVFYDKAVFSMNRREIKDEFESLSLWTEYEAEIIEKQFESAQIQELLKNRENYKFDAVIVEFGGLTPWYAFAEYFNAPLIGITASETSLDIHEALGNSANPITDPDNRYLEITTFRERYEAWKYYLKFNFFYKPKFEAIHDKIIKKFFPEIKTTARELKGKADLVLLNTHPALNYVRPLLPQTIQLGFLHISSPQPLEDEKLNAFIESSEKPIIYINFGSSIKSTDIDPKYLQIFKNVIKTIPFNVIWKWEDETMPNKPENVFITQWTQQADLLANPKIKLFINHGGQLSIEEGIARGLPMIVMPFYGDQTSNSLRVNRLGVGIAVNIQVLTENILKMLIKEIFSGPYAMNARALSEIVQDEPMIVVDKAVWWCEYAIRNRGTQHLKYLGNRVPFYQKYMLDFIGIVVILIHLLNELIKFIFSKIISKKKFESEVKTSKKKNKKNKRE